MDGITGYHEFPQLAEEYQSRADKYREVAKLLREPPKTPLSPAQEEMQPRKPAFPFSFRWSRSLGSRRSGWMGSSLVGCAAAALLGHELRTSLERRASGGATLPGCGRRPRSGT